MSTDSHLSSQSRQQLSRSQSTSPDHPRHVLVVNGPNLDRLGKRQPEIYGSTTLSELENRLVSWGKSHGLSVLCCQSNSEAELLGFIHQAADNNWPVVINPAGLTHTSVILRDALAEVAEDPGFIEVHLSNVHARESFRGYSYLSPLATAVIAGLGPDGYIAALDYFAD